MNELSQDEFVENIVFQGDILPIPCSYSEFMAYRLEFNYNVTERLISSISMVNNRIREFIQAGVKDWRLVRLCESPDETAPSAILVTPRERRGDENAN